jgi:hypothetical protein
MMIPVPSTVIARGSGARTNPDNVSRQDFKERVHPAPSTQTIYAPLGLGKSYEPQIVLNNNSPGNMDVTAAFYTAEGMVAAGRTVMLNSAEVRNMAVADLMSPDLQTVDMAGITLTYFGGMLEVGAQITQLGQDRASSVDIPFSAGMDYRSAAQEAVWWMPKHSEAKIILGNASDAQIAANLKYRDGQSQEVTLRPFATQIVERSSAGENSEGIAESVRIELSGPVGSLRATGFVTSADKRFNSGIRFYDPDTIRQPHLFATNLRLEKSEPRLVLKNVGDTVISAKPRFIPPSGESSAALELPVVSLLPHSAVEVDLKPLEKAAKGRSDFDMVSAQILNESGARNLIGALYSNDLSTKTTYDVPLRDSGPVRNSTGSYPWRIDGDYSTVISITNTREDTTKYLVTINYEGGRYSLDPRELASGETAVFDLRKIRDEEMQDKDGKKIPKSVNVGQFRWSLIGGDTLRLIGRSEVVSLSKGVSSSYSCPVCCPDSFSGLVITPGSSVGPVGGTALLAVDGFLTDCYLYQYGPYAWSVSQWYIENSSVISLAMVSQGSAQMGCLSLGQSQFSGTTNETWYENDGMDCYSRYSPFSDGCCAAVVSVSIGVFPGVGKDQTADVQVTLTPSPIQGSVTLELSTTSGTGVAKFNSNGFTTLNISQTTTVTIKGKTESSTADNIKLEAKAGGQSLGAPIIFTVVKVDLTLRDGSVGQCCVLNDDAGGTQYSITLGTLNLGTFQSSGSGNQLWRTGVEIVGTVTPSNFTRSITIQREIVATRKYNDMTLTSSVGPCGMPTCPDTSDSTLRDDDPQSGASGGKVYDLDAPGIKSASGDPVNTITRVRTNFRQWATMKGSDGTTDIKVSAADLQWFSRLSIIKMSSGDVLRTDISGDNVGRTGTTNLSWNLQ